MAALLRIAFSDPILRFNYSNQRFGNLVKYDGLSLPEDQ